VKRFSIVFRQTKHNADLLAITDDSLSLLSIESLSYLLRKKSLSDAELRSTRFERKLNLVLAAIDLRPRATNALILPASVF
jgi:hypothetical protein